MGNKRMRRNRRGTQPQWQLRARTLSAALFAEALPLVHVTATGYAREIVDGGKLEVRSCKIFNEALIYFFVLRPAYLLEDGQTKTDKINKFPVVFIVSPDAVNNPYHVYPFDTGGAAAGVFSDQADDFVCLEDYELEPKHAAAGRHIGWAFASLEDYFDGSLRNGLVDGIPSYETVTLGYHAIAGMARAGSNQPDKRASAVELASSHDIPLKNNIMAAVIPKQYLEDKNQYNATFIDRLENLGITWRTYDWQPNTRPNEFQREIDRIVRAFYVECGILRE